MKEEAKGKGDVLRKLFFSCLYLSTFTFGGGYVIVTLMKKKFVDDYQWIDEKEMLDLVAIAQSSPAASDVYKRQAILSVRYLKECRQVLER